ncbi:tripartite tricarboxylate transporter substrate binding protein [Roseomonas sp. OT10]|uniref:Bug family tripartite tricarboxylate transporter substrate binding protein n=1 Tax=Roseomonas cutis TaxID=2897332 RepID=UPI001E37D43C|nr:tripartite tricarboxylate transporter substrate binding protein [Roseomonas sp. OT10]UFN50545.1 tripartite tricarboxylate transporter substrate binding protein [Roseomonas sp. OT10]
MPRLLAALGFCLLAALSPAAAQLPDRPLRVIVPSPPGGTGDIVARLLAEAAAPHLPRGAVVDNRAGANGNIGMAEAARGAPDGSVLVQCAFGPCGANPALYAQPGYELDAFVPVILTGAVHNVMVTRRGFPARTLPEVIALVKAKPGTVTFASSGVGASNHLGPELLRTRFGLDWVHVPYRGSGPAITDLVAGTVDVFFDNIPSILPHIRAGAVQPVAVLSAQRLPELPEVPTFGESGAPGVVIDSWFGFLAPPRTPAAVAEALNAAFNQALSQPAVQERLRAAGVEPLGGGTARMGEQVRTESARWAEVVKANGIRAE